MFCEKCGERINDDALFCTNCGFRVKKNERVEKTEPISNTTIEREKVFRTKQNVGVIYMTCMMLFVILAIVSFYKRSEFPEYFYTEERRIMFMLGAFYSIMAVDCLALSIGRMKVKLCIGNLTVSGIVPRGILIREFEYSYDEISEVKCILGCVQFRVNRKWVVMPGLENKEKAKEMIEERIEKY